MSLYQLSKYGIITKLATSSEAVTLVENHRVYDGKDAYSKSKHIVPEDTMDTVIDTLEDISEDMKHPDDFIDDMRTLTGSMVYTGLYIPGTVCFDECTERKANGKYGTNFSRVVMTACMPSKVADMLLRTPGVYAVDDSGQKSVDWNPKIHYGLTFTSGITAITEEKDGDGLEKVELQKRVSSDILRVRKERMNKKVDGFVHMLFISEEFALAVDPNKTILRDETIASLSGLNVRSAGYAAQKMIRPIVRACEMHVIHPMGSKK